MPAPTSTTQPGSFSSPGPAPASPRTRPGPAPQLSRAALTCRITDEVPQPGEMPRGEKGLPRRHHLRGVGRPGTGPTRQQIDVTLVGHVVVVAVGAAKRVVGGIKAGGADGASAGTGGRRPGRNSRPHAKPLRFDRDGQRQRPKRVPVHIQQKRRSASGSSIQIRIFEHGKWLTQ